MRISDWSSDVCSSDRTRDKPMSAKGILRSSTTASSWCSSPERTSASNCKMAASSTPVALRLVTDDAAPGPLRRVGFLGPEGTFTEQALLSQPDLASQELVPMGTFAEVLAAVDRGDTDLGFVAIENSIEGTVTVNMDALALDRKSVV